MSRVFLKGKWPELGILCKNVIELQQHHIQKTWPGTPDESSVNLRSRQWGPRSRVCARKTLRSAPHQREWKFSGAHVWSGGWGLKFSKVFLINFLAKSGNSKLFFFKPIFFGGGGHIVLKTFVQSIFLANQAIVSTFFYFFIFF